MTVINSCYQIMSVFPLLPTSYLNGSGVLKHTKLNLMKQTCPEAIRRQILRRHKEIASCSINKNVELPKLFDS